MPTFTPLSRAELEEVARGQYKRHFPEGPTRPKPVRNIGTVLVLTGAERVEIPYRGRMYELLPVSFEDGLRLTGARMAVEELEHEEPTAERIEAYGNALRLVAKLAPRYLLPRGRVRRLLWRMGIRRNPFRHATDAEVGELLGFFLGCRMRSRVRYPAT